MSEIYKITPAYKKCVYQTEHWVVELSSNKTVELLYTLYFRGGEFEIELNEKEKEEILKKEEIILNDYCVSPNEIWDSCDVFHEIKNRDKYTESELEALIRAFDVIPDKEMVGVAAILSEKVAVMVTTSELETILSGSVSVKVTVGDVLF